MKGAGPAPLHPVSQMAQPSVSQFRSEFDDFLYAPVDESNSGTLLSVLSALARLDVDPWQEAASLARMSRESATQRLASLIVALHGGLLAHLDSRTIAIRLIALLPRAPSFKAVQHETLPQAGTLPISRAIIYVVIINAIFMALASGSQYFMAEHQPPVQVGSSHTLSASTDAPKVPAPSFGK
jgi:hypothetical protein